MSSDCSTHSDFGKVTERSPFSKPGCAWCLALKGRRYSKDRLTERPQRGGPGPGGRVLCPDQPQIEDVRVRGRGGVGMVLVRFWHGVDIVVERFGVDLV